MIKRISTKYDLYIEKVDATYVKVHCSDAIGYELWEYFTITMPKKLTFQHKNWNGEIRLFHKGTHKIYAGLASILCQWCKDNDYEFKADPALAPDKFTIQDASDWIDQQTYLPDHLDRRPYQVIGFKNAIKHRRITLLSPTNSGKSFMIFLIMKYLLDKNSSFRGVIIVPTTTLVEQLHDDFKEYGFNADKYCAKIHSETPEDVFSKKRVIISTWQSMADRDIKLYPQFNFVIGDEAHHFQAKKLKGIMEAMTNAEYRIGTTGTLDGSEHMLMTVTGLFGPTKRLIKTHELIEKGWATPIRPKCLLFKHNPDNYKAFLKGKKPHYQNEIKYLVEHEGRNNYIANLALKQKKNTLVLYNLVDKHGKVLYDKILTKNVNDTHDVYFISGSDVKSSERNVIRKKVNETRDKPCIVVASYGTFSTGINIPNMHNLIFAIGFKSVIRNLQSIGRILRIDEGKEFATLYDIGDDLRIHVEGNFTYRHFVDRVKLYTGERFNPKVYELAFPEVAQLPLI